MSPPYQSDLLFDRSAHFPRKLPQVGLGCRSEPRGLGAFAGRPGRAMAGFGPGGAVRVRLCAWFFPVETLAGRLPAPAQYGYGLPHLGDDVSDFVNGLLRFFGERRGR